MLTDRFPNGSAQDIKDVTDLFYRLSDMDLERTYKCIINNHEYNTFPKIPKIRKYLREDIGEDLTAEKNQESAYYYAVCQECKSVYELEIGWCPVCKKNTHTKIIKSYTPMKVLRGHNGCAACPKWSEMNMGACCDDYGVGRYGECCRDCPCYDCCREMYKINNKIR